jgi:UPF0716 protein FxsA
MNTSQNLFFLFLIVFFLEIYLFITVGSAIGALSTISLVILTAIIGIFILRVQGIMTLQKLQMTVNRGEAPTEAVLYGILLLIGGGLLLIPGFFTDVLGLICVIPITRKSLISYFMLKIQPTTTDSSSNCSTSNSSTADANQTKKQKQKKRRPITIEGEYRRDD